MGQREPMSGERLKGRSVRVAQRATRMRIAALMVVLDITLVVGIYTTLVVLRFDASIPEGYWAGFGWFVVFAALLHVTLNAFFGLYSAIWRYASLNEARRVLLAGGSCLVVLCGYSLFDRSAVPLSLPIVGGVFTTGAIGLLRFQSRLFAYRRNLPGERIRRVAVIGAGSGGAQIVRSMMHSEGHPYQPVCFVDDNDLKVGMRMLGLPVYGPIANIGELADEVDTVLLAIPGASGATVRRITDIVEAAGLPMKVIPNVGEILSRGPQAQLTVGDVRDLEINDLLGRPEISTDLSAVEAMVRGRTVLVTGGGGSIGSEIARQVAAFGPRRLVLLDSDETHLHDARAKISPKVQAESVLASIRDRERVMEIFQEVAPDLVLHAAALKHVPVLEVNAAEAVKTNIEGMEAVVDAAVATNVRRFVFISTDKAVNPSSVMGATKWIGEQLLLDRAPEGAAWSCVRFGNVLGSRGSVLPTFERQIREGGPVTVTDERMTRFFMSVQEAVQLVLQAGALSTGRNIFMLDMGEPVSILELAERMIRLTGKTKGVDIDVEITGMRDGEKLFEELRTPDERAFDTAHPSIQQLEPVSVGRPTLDAQIRSIRRAVESKSRNDEIAALVLSFARSRGDRTVIDLRTRVAPISAAKSS